MNFLFYLFCTIYCFPTPTTNRLKGRDFKI